MKTEICPHCHREYKLGWDGVEEGCDDCLGIVRDSNGYAWYRDDEVHVYENVETGEISVVRREDALRE